MTTPDLPDWATREIEPVSSLQYAVMQEPRIVRLVTRKKLDLHPTVLDIPFVSLQQIASDMLRGEVDMIRAGRLTWQIRSANAPSGPKG